MLRAISIAVSSPGCLLVHKRGREWRAGYGTNTLAAWRHKNRKHLRWVSKMGREIAAKLGFSPVEMSVTSMGITGAVIPRDPT